MRIYFDALRLYLIVVWDGAVPEKYKPVKVSCLTILISFNTLIGIF